MKQLVNEINGRVLPLHFNGTHEAITNWVFNNLDEMELNEAWSCDVELDGNEITISGDEDRTVFNIRDVEVIEL